MPLKRTSSTVVLAFALLLGPGALADAAPSDDGFFLSRDAYLRAFPEGEARDFAAAVWQGDAGRALQLAGSLPHGVNTPGEQGHTALEIAAYRHDRAMLAALLNAGANPNGGPDHAPIGIIAHDGQTKGFADMARLLIKAGANVDGLYAGERAIDEACVAGDTARIQTLIALHADINKDPGNVGYPTLILAKMGEWSLVEYLLHHGADIWLADQMGNTLGSIAQAQLRPEEFALIVESEDTPEKATREKEALAATIVFLKGAGLPWPPPRPEDVLRLRRDGLWPPHPREP